MQPNHRGPRLIDQRISPGKLVTGTDFRKDLPREIEQAREDEDTVNALERAYTWFEQQEKRQEDWAWRSGPCL